MIWPDCSPEDHDETGARTELHEMDLIQAAWLLEVAKQKGWPTSPFGVKANHHLCGGISRDYVNECFADSGDGGSPEGCGPVTAGPHPPNPIEGMGVANPNCGTCRGSGTKSKLEKGTKENGEEYEWWRQVPCGC